MNKLILAEDVFDALDSGKFVTIRKGRRDIQLGSLEFESLELKRSVIVDVSMVYFCHLDGVIPSDVINDGFEDYDDMLACMKRFYPDITFS